MLESSLLGAYLAKGGPVVGVLYLVSVVALAIALERAWRVVAARRGEAETVAGVAEAVRAGRWADALGRARAGRGPVSKALEALVLHRDRDDRRERILFAGNREIARLGRNVRALAAIANLSVMLGLFGTVLGMVDAFQAIEAHHGAVDPSILAGGIWTALLTTVVGLAIAIPSLAAYHVLMSQVEGFAERAKEAVARVLELEERAAAGPAASGGASPAAGRVAGQRLS